MCSSEKTNTALKKDEDRGVHFSMTVGLTIILKENSMSVGCVHILKSGVVLVCNNFEDSVCFSCLF